MRNLQFDAHAAAYSAVNAYALAQLANLAYAKKLDIKRQTKDWGFDSCDVLNENDTQVFIAASSDAIVVAFRGTSDINNWITDVNIHLTGGPLGRVHEGFLAALNVVWLELLQAILDAQPSASPASGASNGPGPSRSLWFTGHSLGGALATLAVAKMIERAQPVDGLYTCGCPRWGDATFASNFNSDFDRAYRFIYNQDIVTRLPPRIPFGYRHVGTVEFIDAQCQISGELSGWAAFLRTVEVTMAELQQKDLNAIEDHQITNYLKCLGQNA
jgi:triacylglycerol lipase